MKTVEFTNSVDPDEAAHNELPHLGLHCLPSSFCTQNMTKLGMKLLFGLLQMQILSSAFSALKGYICSVLINMHWFKCFNWSMHTFTNKIL